MARAPRLLVPGYPHHLIQRGNNRQPTFLDDADRREFLRLLHDLARERTVRVHAYVLMDNHVHLLATPEAADDLSRLMQSLGRSYVGWFNKRHGRTGGLWEGRFKAAVVDTEHYLLACQRYIELNPVRAGMAADAADYAWSSARHHLGRATDRLVTDHPLYWALGNTPFEREAAYRELLAHADVAETERITKATRGGKVLGSEPFVAQLSQAVSRPLGVRRRGRPRKVGMQIATDDGPADDVA